MHTRLVPVFAALLVPATALAQDPAPAEVAPPEQAAPVEEEPEVSVEPPEEEPPPAAEQAPRPTPPPPPWVRRVHGRVAGSIVRIRCGWHRGVGFVFETDDVVASTARWDRCTRGIEVVLPDGRVLEVERGRVSHDAGLVLLRLPAPSGLAPLRPRQRPLAIGDEVAVVAREGRGDGYVTIRPGTVIAEPDRLVRTDLSAESDAGAPVVDERGRVAGVTHRGWGDELHVVPAERLGDVAAAPEDTLGRVFTLGLGVLGELMLVPDPGVEDRDVWLGGFGVQAAATLFDRLSLVAAYGYLRDTSDMFEDGLVERTARRHQADLRLAWRFLPIPALRTYVIPAIGAWANWDRWTDRRLRVQVDDPTCSIVGSACTVSTDIVEQRNDEFAITPYVQLSLKGRFIELGYSLGLTVDDPTLVHRLFLGIWLGGY